MTRAEAHLGRPDMDLTSMIDVVFLLLIFFLTTLHFKVLEQQLPTHLPKDMGGLSSKLSSLMLPFELHIARGASGPQVRVGSKGRAPAAGVSGSEWIGVGGVESRVAAARAQLPDLAILIHSGAGVLHEDVVSVVDACLSAGVQKISFGRGP